MSNDLFSSDFFSGNRERLKALFTGTAPIVLSANGRLQKGSDEAFPFHQDRNFWYLTGIDEPDVVLVMDKNKEYLIVPGRDEVRETFDGVVDFATLARQSGIKDIYNEKDGWRHLESRVKKVKHVATIAAPPKYVDFWGMYTNPARATLTRKLKKINGDIELLDLRQHLSRLRMVKQDAELEALQRAIDITAATLKEISRPTKLAKYAYEYEIEADITRGFRRRGALGHGFTPIVASGARACTLHNIADLSLMAKARGYERGFPQFIFDAFTQFQEKGPNYLHALLTGFEDEPPKGFTLPEGSFYNKYFPGHAMKMPNPLSDGQVTYDDGTPQKVDQYAKDVSAFLMWAAEPKLDERKRIGLQVMIFMLVFAGLLYFTKKAVWADAH